MQEIEGRICPPPDGNIVIVVARFNKTITRRLLDGALAKLHEHQVREQNIRVVWVPGAYELPFVASYFARDPDCLAVICLGAVIKGDTTHDQHINRSVSMAIGEIASRYGKPVIFGVITCDTVQQADARSGMIESAKDKILNPAPGNKGAEAAEAALEMIDLMTELPEIEIESPFSGNFSMPFSDKIPLPPMLARMFAEDDGDSEEDFSFPPQSRKPVKKGVKKTGNCNGTKKKCSKKKKKK